MTEVARLQISVDSDGYDRATRRGRTFAQSAREAERSTEGLGRESQRTGQRLSGVGASAGSASVDLQRMAGVVAGLAAALGTAAGASASFSRALDLDSAVGELATLLPGARAEVDAIADSAREMAREFGSTQTEQIRAFYQAVSAGATDAADAARLMDAANRLAIGGVTDVETAVTILSSSVNAFASDSLTAADAADTLFTGVRLGQTTVSELASTLGRAIPAASAVGVSFQELVASVASLTAQGQSTEIAVTGISGALSQLLNPSSQARDLAADLGVEFSAAAVRAQGLEDFLQSLTRATGGNQEQMAQLFGSIEALRAVFTLAGNGADSFSAALDQMKDRAGAAEQAFTSQAERLNQQWARAMANAAQVSDDFGTSLLQGVAPAAEAVTDVLVGAEDASLALEIAMKGATAAVGVFSVATGTRAVASLVASSASVRAYAAAVALVGPASATATAGVSALTVATRALLGPVGLAITAVGALTGAWVAYGRAAGDAARAQEELNQLEREQQALANSLIVSREQQIRLTIEETIERRRLIDAKLEEARIDRARARDEVRGALARAEQEAANNIPTLGDRVAQEQVDAARAALDAAEEEVRRLDGLIEGNNANLDRLLDRLRNLRTTTVPDPDDDDGDDDPVESSDPISVYASERVRIEAERVAALERQRELARSQIEHELELARLRGDDQTVDRLSDEIRMRERIVELTALTGDAAAARTQAEAERDAIEQARAQGETREFFRDAFSEGFLAMLDGNGDALSNWWRDHTERALRNVLDALADEFFDLFSGAGGGAAGGSGERGILSAGWEVVSGLLGGNRAGGGPVRPGASYMVGESGAERFTPMVPGVITPSGGTGRGGGVTIQQTVNVNAVGAVNASEVDRRVRAGVMESAPLIIQAVEERQAEREWNA